MKHKDNTNYPPTAGKVLLHNAAHRVNLILRQHARHDALENNPYRNNKCIRLHLTKAMEETGALQRNSFSKQV